MKTVRTMYFPCFLISTGTSTEIHLCCTDNITMHPNSIIKRESLFIIKTKKPDYTKKSVSNLSVYMTNAFVHSSHGCTTMAVPFIPHNTRHGLVRTTDQLTWSTENRLPDPVSATTSGFSSITNWDICIGDTSCGISPDGKMTYRETEKLHRGTGLQASDSWTNYV